MRGIRTTSLGEQLGSLGEFIAAQRRAAELSLRQLAEQTGVSNPYLSQIERGLRRPSAEVLQQLAKALRVSAETLYVRAGILDPDEHRTTSVEVAVLADKAITERQKSVLIDIYRSFASQNGSSTDQTGSPADLNDPADGAAARTRTRTTKKDAATGPATTGTTTRLGAATGSAPPPTTTD